jgi:hypothetical protein
MKKRIQVLLKLVIATLLFRMAVSPSLAQSPEKLSYQAIIRNAANNLVINQAVGMRISILQGSAAGASVYTETHSATSDQNGLVTIEVGAGTPVLGTFSGINWSGGPYFLKTEIDPLGGTTYTMTGTSQFLSVPYALYAKTADYNNLSNKPVLDGSETKISAGRDVAVTGNGTIATPYQANQHTQSVTRSQRDAITSPTAGQIVWCNDCGTAGETQVFNGIIWTNIIGGTAAPALPTVTTTAISSITQTTASSGGNVTSDGGSAVTARGVCWSTSSNPTTSNSKTTDGSGTGSFTSSITGLNPLTTYYVRAYATSNAGTSYGSERSFTTTAAIAPSLTTTAISSIYNTTASGGGNISSDGGSAVTSRGVCWSTSSNPTTSNSKTTDGSGSGSFTSSLTGLTRNTTYYVRAYATNGVGTAYGNEVSFTTANVTFSIGMAYQGGKIAYIDGTNDHGFISALSDLAGGTLFAWQSIVSTTNATGSVIGTGLANTTLMVNSPAKTAVWGVNINGYTDWYIPSKNELLQLQANQAILGNFIMNGIYWSSTEKDNGNAYFVNFLLGTSNSFGKGNTQSVRPIRAF